MSTTWRALFGDTKHGWLPTFPLSFLQLLMQIPCGAAIPVREVKQAAAAAGFDHRSIEIGLRHWAEAGAVHIQADLVSIGYSSLDSPEVGPPLVACSPRLLRCYLARMWFCELVIPGSIPRIDR